VARAAVEGLGAEPWTFVRRASLAVAARAPKDASIDRSLATALEGELLPDVREQLVRTLGARGASAEASVLLATASGSLETAPVRRAAIEALAAVCARGAIEELTELASRGTSPRSELDLVLAMSSLGALGALAPADLAARLAVFESDEAPPPVREEAKRALRAAKAPRCR
jgi:hypothetical protein